jgi:hypothetical protein
MTRATVTPLEALTRLIAVAKEIDYPAPAFETANAWNKFQGELAVAEMVVRDWAEPKPVAWCAPDSDGKPKFGTGWCFARLRDSMATMPLYAAPQPEATQGDVAVVNAQLVEALTGALAVIDDYLAYDHNGDPWTEDARTMGEMDINDYKHDGRLDAAHAALAAAGVKVAL